MLVQNKMNLFENKCCYCAHIHIHTYIHTYIHTHTQCGSIPMVLVQNKVDLIDKAVATSEEVEALAKRLKVKLYRTCVSENLNVDK